MDYGQTSLLQRQSQGDDLSALATARQMLHDPAAFLIR
jgi:hypothetical protein